jgi:hypothetical protein
MATAEQKTEGDTTEATLRGKTEASLMTATSGPIARVTVATETTMKRVTKAATRNAVRTTAAANEDKAAKRTLAAMSGRGTAANAKDLETNAKTNAKDLEANVKTNAKDLKTNAKNPETSEANQDKKRVYEVSSPNWTPTTWCSRVLGTTVSYDIKLPELTEIDQGMINTIPGTTKVLFDTKTENEGLQVLLSAIVNLRGGPRRRLRARHKSGVEFQDEGADPVQVSVGSKKES